MIQDESQDPTDETPTPDEENVEPTAGLRLRQAIGEELAQLLLNALAGDHRRVGLGAAS